MKKKHVFYEIVDKSEAMKLSARVYYSTTNKGELKQELYTTRLMYIRYPVVRKVTYERIDIGKRRR